jgi:hypothetical protein
VTTPSAEFHRWRASELSASLFTSLTRTDAST